MNVSLNFCLTCFEGEYKFDRLHVNGLRKLKQYGPLVREDIVPGVPLVWVYTPSDIETVYRCEVNTHMHI